MTGLKILLEGDGALFHVRDRVVEGEMTTILLLDGGMGSGRPSIGVVIELPDGKVVLGQTSLSLLLIAAELFKAKHGDPRLDDATKGTPS
jgi:hypothetical protein